MVKFDFIFAVFLLVSRIKIARCMDDAVVIIGAGASGMTAASALLEAGYQDVLVLEAEPRIGGRIHTVVSNGTKLDLGAQWCDGQKSNIVYEKLSEWNLLEMLRRDHFPKQFYHSDRRNISYEFSGELAGIFRDAEGELRDSTKNLGDALQERYTQVINTKYNKSQEKLRISRDALSYLSHLVLRTRGAASWSVAAAYDPDYYNKQGFAYGWKDGFSSFFDALTRKHRINDKILLGKRVAKIVYGDALTKNVPVKVICSDNSVYPAKRVIVTSSLGVLKENVESMFEPPVNASKLTAIGNIGYGAVLKVFASFEANWWGNSPGFNFIWSDKDKADATIKFPFGPKNSKGESWITEHFHIFAVPDSKVLLVWYTGELVPIIEKMDQEILKDGIYFTLNLFLGHLFDVLKPITILRSNWKSNPNFRGTNSFASLKTTDQDRRNLQEPIVNSLGEPLIQFAGEATSIHRYSSVQGAVESGYREADRLIKLRK
ncbi:unnamed protein product [Phyllotreta striolata]|uniref:Amine oxidase domain-containing protein n=1 Tax=Phyllotreta striolata TaxID=444603 RepID=A0A9N9TV38_PHYSR|nr:unnamed protein product [Phyllotreta striolata]